jgi:hypothetical protein
MANDTVLAKEISKWLKDMHFLQAMGDTNSQKLPLLGQISTTKGHLMGDFNGGGNSVEPGKKPKSNIGKSPLYAGLKDKQSNNKSMQGKELTIKMIQHGFGMTMIIIKYILMRNVV